MRHTAHPGAPRRITTRPQLEEGLRRAVARERAAGPAPLAAGARGIPAAEPRPAS
jgi:hypothetical protein